MSLDLLDAASSGMDAQPSALRVATRNAAAAGKVDNATLQRRV